MNKLKIVSWNIWVDCDFNQLKEYLLSASADIIGLQEVKDDDPERDVIGFLEGLGYQYVPAMTEQVWDGKQYRHGPAIFSLLPVMHSEKIQLEEGDDERAAAYAQVSVNGKILHVFSTHLIHTHQQPSKSQEDQVNKLIDKLPSKNVVVVGDFNATPESESIKTIKNILVDTDSASLPTWCVHPKGCNSCKLGVVDTRLDYIFVSKSLKTSMFEVGESRASDHLPISVNIEI